MTAYLLMRLYGPLASWGEIAVGEVRHSSVHPSRSALIGMLAAALGIERDDAAAQHSLTQGYRFGVKLECVGSPMRDYHTVQSGVPSRKVRFRSRRHELLADRIETILSAREYRCDSLAIVAVEAIDAPPYTLERLADALRHPRFPLYLGRRSCPPALPLAPRIVQAATLREALDSTPQGSLLALLERDPDKAWPTHGDQRFLGRRASSRYYWEHGMHAGMQASFDIVRHDQPLSRSRWQFAPRRELVHISGNATR